MSGRVLVVVGAGCIGCRTVEQLLHSGFEVTVLDDLANGRSDPVLTVDFIEGDMSNRELLPVAGIFRTRNISSVMHFAASIDVGESVRNPAKYCENHVVRTIGQLNSMMQDREIQGSHSK